MPIIYEKVNRPGWVLKEVVCNRCGISVEDMKFATLTFETPEERCISVYCTECYDQITSGDQVEPTVKEYVDL